ncbi:hypothetical protein SDC9_161709 [bioreactor metagenome]|uniref:Uncharacterized protein n=1 Tax=bioreactor metagenome TaxID=1076179 RepID=A0A645FLF3_9ZZZZ
MRVVRAVDEHIAYALHAAWDIRARDPFAYGFFICAQKICSDRRARGVRLLVVALERRLIVAGRVRDIHFALKRRGAFFNHAHDFVRLLVAYKRYARFEYAALFLGDLLKHIAEYRGMVKRDARNNRYVWNNRARRVEPPAEPSFEHGELAAATVI